MSTPPTEPRRMVTRLSTRQSTTLALSSSPLLFPVGTKVEVRINEAGYRGSWFTAFITHHLKKKTIKSTLKYGVKYVSLIKEDVEEDEVSAEFVRPEPPCRIDGKKDQQFELYDLVEAFPHEGWWYGIISGLRNTVTGEYRVSLPLSREAFDLSPSKVRHQMSYIDGNWFPVEPKPKKEEKYKIGDKVEAKEIREKYGISWFPSTIEKIITQNIFLIKYESPNYLPKNKHLTEIIDSSFLRLLSNRNPKSNKIILNSEVEFFHEGAWSNGIVTRVNSDGNYSTIENYLIKFGEKDNLEYKLFTEEFVRLSFDGNRKKLSKFKTMGKRRRPDGKANSVSAKMLKNNISVSPKGGTSVPLSENNNSDLMNNSVKRVKTAVCKFPKRNICINSSPFVSLKNAAILSQPSDSTKGDLIKKSTSALHTILILFTFQSSHFLPETSTKGRSLPKKPPTAHLPPNAFPAGSTVEVRSDAEGFIGSWFEAVVLSQSAKSDRVSYRVEFLTLMKDDNPDLHEIEEVDADDVRPVAPMRRDLKGGEEVSDPGFEMHELVEAYHDEGWWYGVISGLRNPVTQKYRVSFPLSREVIDFCPSQIRPQMDYINGKWFPRKPKPQKTSYKVGQKVESQKICEKFGSSWFPSIVEKIIQDDNFLIKYENEKYTPYGHFTEIVDFSSLRPVPELNPKFDKIELNSNVEFFNLGAWTNGVVQSISSHGRYLIRVCENDDVTPFLVYEGFVRLNLDWDGKKWVKAITLGKRGRSARKNRFKTAKRKKNDNSVPPRIIKTVVSKCPRSILLSELYSSSSSISIKKEGTSRQSSDSTADAGDDVSKGNSQNRDQQQKTPNSEPVSKNDLISTPNPSPNPNKISSPSNPIPSQVSTPPNPNLNPNQVSSPRNPNPNLNTPSSSISGNNIGFPLWNDVLKLMDIFRKIPQTPHFANLQTCCNKEELEGRAFDLAVTYINLYRSIQALTLDTDLSEFNTKLQVLDSLHKDGFETDPLRTRLNTMIESKIMILESGFKRSKLENELTQQEKDKYEVYENVDRIRAELAERKKEWEERERRLKERLERELERKERNGENIWNLKGGIVKMERNIESAREKFVAASNINLGRN